MCRRFIVAIDNGYDIEDYYVYAANEGDAKRIALDAAGGGTVYYVE